MVFNSFSFLIFFPIVLGLYFILPQKFRWVMLLAASYYFYMSWNADLIYLILFTTIISYVSAILIENGHRKHPNNPNGRMEKFWLVLTLAVSLGVLFFFKYFNFLSRSVADIISKFTINPANPLILDLILPVGISFYTFQTLSYVIDVYRGNVKTERHFGYYALYVSFFPQLVAGPIERPENLIPQLHLHHKPDFNRTISGGRKMLIGFFKKVVVADLFAPYVNTVYNAPENATGFTVALATFLFAFQIYGDFSGYTDIAIGCSEIMGIHLMQNFDRPYISCSIKEFWRRWHISLSGWFKDYIYFPLGGSRCSTARHMFNICVVFLVSGLWHGASWTFVLWGLLHGIYQVIGHFTEKPRNAFWKKLHVSEKSCIVRSLRQFNTFLLVCFGWILFRANSFGDLKILIIKLFTDWSFSDTYFSSGINAMGLSLLSCITCLLSLLIMQRLDADKLCNNEKGLSVSRYVFIIWVIALAWIFLLQGDGASSFIYFQF